MSEIAGSIRREEENVGDIDIVVVVPNPDDPNQSDWWASTILEAAGVPVSSGGHRKATGQSGEFKVDLWTCTREEFGAMMFYATGPRGYNISYRKMAKQRGWKLNEKGLWDENGNRIAGYDECEIYNMLGRSWVEPKLRGYRPRKGSHKGESSHV